MMIKLLKAAISIAYTAILEDAKYDPSDPDCIDEADWVDPLAAAIGVNRKDLVEVLVFTRTVLHNLLVNMRPDGPRFSPEEASSVRLIAELLDQIPDVYFDLDEPVVLRLRQPVQAQVPMCMQYSLHGMIERSAKRAAHFDTSLPMTSGVHEQNGLSHRRSDRFHRVVTPRISEVNIESICSAASRGLRSLGIDDKKPGAAAKCKAERRGSRHLSGPGKSGGQSSKRLKDVRSVTGTGAIRG